MGAEGFKQNVGNSGSCFLELQKDVFLLFAVRNYLSAFSHLVCI